MWIYRISFLSFYFLCLSRGTALRLSVQNQLSVSAGSPGCRRCGKSIKQQEVPALDDSKTGFIQTSTPASATDAPTDVPAETVEISETPESSNNLKNSEAAEGLAVSNVAVGDTVAPEELRSGSESSDLDKKEEDKKEDEEQVGDAPQDPTDVTKDTEEDEDDDGTSPAVDAPAKHLLSENSMEEIDKLLQMPLEELGHEVADAELPNLQIFGTPNPLVVTPEVLVPSVLPVDLLSVTNSETEGAAAAAVDESSVGGDADASTAASIPETDAETVASIPETDASTVASIPETDANTVASIPETDAETVASIPETDAETVASIPETDAETVASIPETGASTVALIPETDAEPVASVSETDVSVRPSVEVLSPTMIPFESLHEPDSLGPETSDMSLAPAPILTPFPPVAQRSQSALKEEADSSGSPPSTALLGDIAHSSHENESGSSNGKLNVSSLGAKASSGTIQVMLDHVPNSQDIASVTFLTEPDCFTLLASLFGWTFEDKHFARVAALNLVATLEEVPNKSGLTPDLEKKILSSVNSLKNWAKEGITIPMMMKIRRCVIDKDSGHTILQRVVEYGMANVLHSPFFDSLVTEISLNKPDMNGNTLLHLAAISESPTMTSLIIKSCMSKIKSPERRLALFEARNNAGMTALQVAHSSSSSASDLLKSAYGTIRSSRARQQKWNARVAALKRS